MITKVNLKFYDSCENSHFNQRTFRKMQSHLAYRHSEMCILIRNIICESLVKIQHFIYEWKLIMCENSQKRNKIKWRIFWLKHLIINGNRKVPVPRNVVMYP